MKVNEIAENAIKKPILSNRLSVSSIIGITWSSFLIFAQSLVNTDVVLCFVLAE